MDYNVNEWNHVFKLDPNKHLSDSSLKKVCESGTDAVIIGGTDGITYENVVALLMRVQAYEIPCVLEVSAIHAISPEFDGYFIPMVFNSKEKRFMLDVQHEAVKQFGDFIDWSDMLVEGYCVMNEQAKVFQATNCTLPDQEDVIAYARMAEHMFHLPIFYIEYSGRYGDVNLVRETAEQLHDTMLFYGGGIRSAAEAKQMKEHADVIVVGDILYENIQAALETVQACKE
ncbi:heptaprenylglyceryl phosphate synthase [Halobacillus amylolyticus]|uniref:Heptaprenylglyceryl phosphate synthase n=1 Tax=Halobacillus amylolyticus TaxID=2932259 RepID=A0ABY4H5R5_9BACI|nr:heptaprenylglyceryl phosphate synthase [Halobacillus amylolyticus]UOR10195.1 heptaprenylglyceryl phosphate synthase [Halobacillus amylolyticus]